MKILFLSNYFPPASIGGYEQWCQEVALGLMERGHQVSVITSRADVADNGGIKVYRPIELEVTGGIRSTIGRFLRRNQLETSSLTAVKKILSDIQPDAALIWGMWNVPRAVPALVESLLPGRTAYYFCDYWPTLPSAFVQQLLAPARRRLATLPKRLLAHALLSKAGQAPRLELQHPICVSQAVQRLLMKAGIPLPHARVIYGGTEVQPPKPCGPAGAFVRLLYLGRLTADKGLHTAIEAVGILSDRALNVHLDIYGQGDQTYVRRLQKTIQERKLSASVHFLGNATRAELPRLFTQYDALVFPSQWEEPFARTVLEAMAANLPVIGTTTGGTGEILKNRETGLTFKAGDAFGLADQIECLARECAPVQRFVEAARDAVLRHFTLTRMVDQIEEALSSIVDSTLTVPRLVNI